MAKFSTKKGASEKVNPFPHDKGLTTRTVIFVPSTKDKSKKISKKDFDQRVDETQKFMNKRFGGSTTIKGAGSYTVTPKRAGGKPKLIKEDVVEVENFSSQKDWARHRSEVEKYAESRQKKWGQDSIGFEIQSPKQPLALHFVKAHARRAMRRIS